MNFFTSILRSAALLGISSLALHAAPPAAVTAKEIEALREDAKTKAPEVNAANAAAQASLATDMAASDETSKAVATFLAQADLPAVPAEAQALDAQPLEVKNGPNDTVINCTGGMYFDADAGVLVYMKNVTVKDPRYNLTGADELKIFFEKKPVDPKEQKPNKEKEKPTDKSEPGIGGDIGAKFGDVERIVATGAVRLDQKAVAGKEPIKASGRIFTYNLKQNLIILSGGFPWFTQGSTYMRAKEADLTLQIFPKTGSFATEGNWEMGGNLDQKR